MFQSTPPTRGATMRGLRRTSWQVVSIHAPHAGGDHYPEVFRGRAISFNPRPPRGGRHFVKGQRQLVLAFQSTPPTRGATSPANKKRNTDGCFNPRPPRGGRLSVPKPLVAQDQLRGFRALRSWKSLGWPLDLIEVLRFALYLMSYRVRGLCVVWLVASGPRGARMPYKIRGPSGS